MQRRESNGTAIQASDLCKSFVGQPVLSGVDLKVATGETLAVLGRSGVGKSVLLRLLIGLQKPDSGTMTSAVLRFGNIQLPGAYVAVR